MKINIKIEIDYGDFCSDTCFYVALGVYFVQGTVAFLVS